MITKPDWSKAPSQATEFYPETPEHWAAYAAWRNGQHLLWIMEDGVMPSFPIPEKYPQLRPRKEAIQRIVTGKQIGRAHV